MAQRLKMQPPFSISPKVAYALHELLAAAGLLD